MKAIKKTHNNFVSVYNSYNGADIMDSNFKNADCFVEFERFDHNADKLRRTGKGIDYLSICSPNYLHGSHIIYVLLSWADVICEKPIVRNP